jgi:hypothetical protein
MSTAMIVGQSGELEREESLMRLAEAANEAHQDVVDSARKAVLRAVDAGRAFLEARRICRKKTWTSWLAAHFHASSRTAQDYMRIAVYVAEMGGDPHCVTGLSFNAVRRMRKGRPCSDGRANPHRSAQRREPVASTLPPPAMPDKHMPTAATAAPRAAADGDPFEPVVRLLEQAVAELRCLMQSRPEHARYARHLMQPLARIRGGVASRHWFWDMIKR